MKSEELLEDTICCDNPFFEDSTTGLQIWRRCLNCGETWERIEVIEEKPKKEGRDE